MERLKKEVIAILVIISGIVLFGLLIFADRLAATVVSRKYPVSLSTDEDMISFSEENTESQAALSIASETLVYDGSTSFNVMDGVTATDVDGSDITDNVSAVITEGSSVSAKTIKYQVYDSSGILWQAQRALELENYSGPELIVPASITLRSENLNDLLAYLEENGQISADNGYGVKELYRVSYEMEPAEEEGHYQVFFSLSNDFNDVVNAEAQALVVDQVNGPVIVLNTYEVTLQVGEDFIFNRYIDYTYDPVDGDLSTRIHLNGSVDTEVPGTYTVEYYAYNTAGEMTNVETLVVNVTP